MGAKILLAALAVCAPGVALADPCEAPLPRPGTAFIGQVRYVGDGDSLCVGTSSDPRTWVEVRLADFYAPELQAPGGAEAKRALQGVASGQMLQCRAGDRSYDRVVARCTLGGASVGDLMRRTGVREGGRGR
ncbi:nuclease [Phenylobacterium sp.]|jgi:endonuclease YncB( thermonuclease family)|uniref:thermonuclease family protein n=1 Tax=Phenylobacterium sp. TaxID=1871053 RepID=UPI002F93B96A